MFLAIAQDGTNFAAFCKAEDAIKFARTLHYPTLYDLETYNRVRLYAGGWEILPRAANLPVLSDAEVPEFLATGNAQYLPQIED